MPQYKFKDHNTGKTWLEWMGIQEADDYLAANSHIERLVNGAPMLVRGKPVKPDNGFRDVLKEIKGKAGRRSTINTF